MKIKYNKDKFKQKFAITPHKQLGQHFLSDKNYIDNIIDIITTTAKQYNCNEVHEIGPGTGVLTKPLLEHGLSVCAIEKDIRAIEVLKSAIAPLFVEKLLLINSDILKWQPVNVTSATLCVGNLPYYITSDILLWLYQYRSTYSASIFMIQNEVADRLVAKHGCKAYGRLSIRMQIFFTMRKLLVVPPEAFVPPPKVTSAIIELIPNGYAFESEAEDKFFERLTAVLFSARRKMLRRVFAKIIQEEIHTTPDFADIFWNFASANGITPEIRPDALSVKTILNLHKFLWNNNYAKQITVSAEMLKDNCIKFDLSEQE